VPDRKKHFLFIFLDGVGLGKDEPLNNPFSRARLPVFQDLLNGEKFTESSAPLKNGRAALLALDANLGVSGLPQSATGQAALLTGSNIPASLGYHYGPKPNPPIADLLKKNTIFHEISASGLKTAYLNAFPPGYFKGIETRRRLYSAVPLAATSSGLKLRTIEDLRAGKALSADFTGQGWHNHLGFSDTPLMTAAEAGEQMSKLASDSNFSFFEYWLSDFAGHRQDMQQACQLLTDFDQVLGGLLSEWHAEDALVLITSDHGNLEDLSTRRHTNNPVPALVIGKPELRAAFTISLTRITDIAPAIYRFFNL
jgi:2,3-bisphosphoglycerate-independent phosphoglycerate mutase